MPYTRISNDRLRADLDASIKWFEEILGRSIADTRLAEIRDTLDKIDKLRADPAERYRIFDHVDRVVAYYSWTDALGFVRIWKGLRTLSDQVLPRQLLQRALKGPLSPADETLDDSDSRNIFTQLELAADLAMHGLQPVAFEDLEFDFRDCHYIAECKRLWSESLAAVNRNLQRSCDQLEIALSRDKSRVRRGLIVFAIERIADLNLRLPMEIPVESEADVLKLTREMAKLFVEHYGPLAPKVKDVRIIAVVLLARALVHTMWDNTFGPVFVPTFVRLRHKSTEDYKRITRLTRFINKSS